MIQYIIPLVASWIPIWSQYLIYLFAVEFVGWVATLIFSFLRGS